MAEAARREDWPQTVAEFETWHARQPDRWEFIDGIRGWRRHRSNTRLSRPTRASRCARQWRILGCTALIDGPQILTDEISALPDVVVTCSAIDLATPVIAEPVIIVAVMSPSSEADDAGGKWFSYRKIPSLRPA
jgi:hypothetical protein